ncbi:MAG: hypothetical protein M3O85_02635 [Acidobacteriota bacterium]|nr:hypothetical protein [Acidobacteriota bacterium]
MFDWFRDVGAWLVAVARAWYGWLPSSALAALVGYGQNLGFWNPGKKTYVVIIALGVVVSLFDAWRKEHKAAGSGKPDFRLELTSAISHYEADKTLVLLGMRIRNKGAESAVYSFDVNYTSPSLSCDHAQLLIVANDPLVLNLPKGPFVFNRAQNIVLQATTPIRHGGFVSGRLAFSVPGDRTQEVRDGKAVITVKLTDYMDNAFTETFRGTGPHPGSPGYMFGEPLPDDVQGIAMGDVGKINPKPFRNRKRRRRR